MKWTTLENMTHGNNRQPILPGPDDESMDGYSEKDDSSSDTIGNLFCLLLKFDQVEQQTASFDKYKVFAINGFLGIEPSFPSIKSSGLYPSGNSPGLNISTLSLYIATSLLFGLFQ